MGIDFDAQAIVTPVLDIVIRGYARADRNSDGAAAVPDALPSPQRLRRLRGMEVG